MDCNQVNEAGVIESYLTGRLDAAQQEAFEEHYFGCPRCFEALATCRVLQQELATSREGLHPEPLPQRLPWRWVWVAGLAAAGIVAAVGLWRRDTGPVAPTPPPVASRPLAGARPQPGGHPSAPIPAAPSLAELAQVRPPDYTPVTLRGAPDQATQRFHQAMRLYLKSDYRGAIPGLRTALEMNPKAADASFYLAACHLLLGQNDAAVAGLKETIALGDTPYLEDAHFYLAKAFLQKRDVSSAKRELKRITELHGDREEEARDLLRKFQQLKTAAR